MSDVGTVEVVLVDASTPPLLGAWGKEPPWVAHPVPSSASAEGEKVGVTAGMATPSCKAEGLGVATQSETLW